MYPTLLIQYCNTPILLIQYCNTPLLIEQCNKRSYTRLFLGEYAQTHSHFLEYYYRNWKCSEPPISIASPSTTRKSLPRQYAQPWQNANELKMDGMQHLPDVMRKQTQTKMREVPREKHHTCEYKREYYRSLPVLPRPRMRRNAPTPIPHTCPIRIAVTTHNLSCTPRRDCTTRYN